MASLRTPEGEKKYRDYLQKNGSSTQCDLCLKDSIRSFTFWRIVENIFPYDYLAKVHHMLIPIRHVTEKELTEEERRELLAIKESLGHSEYDWIIEPTHKNKSIPHHFHLHLLVGK